MPAVWLELNGREWHVDEGSAEHERLVLDGATVIDGASDDESEGYASLGQPALKKLVAERELVADSAKKKDLIAALEADDANTDEDDESTSDDEEEASDDESGGELS